ncbi:oligosaccharide flippase family protein [Photobacterium damselae]|uniref:oligosaccharide flippase family protein n=1 Tax=Photobacterium damselae TaxID=38293 RepID=UPI000D6658BD|nr:oligosaccharide flippase family protein [Photobacterium damselae]AWK81317.1 hypothetical protein BST98_04200 [Photobacterium damselae]
MLNKLIRILPSKIVPGLCSILFVQILSNVFSTSDYGKLSLSISICIFLSIISYDWISQVITRFFSDKIESLSLFYLIVSWVVGVLILFTITALFSINVDFWIVCLVSLSISIFNFLLDLVRLNEFYNRFSLYSSLRNICYLVISYLYIKFSSIASTEYILLCWFIANIVISLLMFLFLKRKNKLNTNIIKDVEHKKYFRYGIPLIVNSMVLFFISSSDRFVLSYFGLEKGLGIYSLNYDLVFKTFGSLSILTWYILYPKLIEDDKEFGNKEFILKYIKLSILSYSILLPCLLFYYINFININYINYVLFFTLVLSIFLWDMKNLCFDSINKIMLQTKTIMMISIFICILNLLLNIIFIPIGGFMVAAYSSLFCYFIGVFLSLILSIKKGYNESTNY